METRQFKITDERAVRAVKALQKIIDEEHKKIERRRKIKRYISTAVIVAAVVIGYGLVGYADNHHVELSLLCAQELGCISIALLAYMIGWRCGD